MVFSSGMWWISLAGKLLRSCCWPDHFQSGTAVELSRLPKVLPYVLRILRRSLFCHEEGQTLEHNNRFVLEHRPPVPLCLCTRSELLEWDCSPGDIYGVTSGSSATPLLGPVWPVGLWKSSCGSTRNTLTPVASAELFPHFPFKFSTHGNRGGGGGGGMVQKTLLVQGKATRDPSRLIKFKAMQGRSTVSEVICIWCDWVLDNTGRELK